MLYIFIIASLNGLSTYIRESFQNADEIDFPSMTKKNRRFLFNITQLSVTFVLTIINFAFFYPPNNERKKEFKASLLCFL